jgi:hypothetical protein
MLPPQTIDHGREGPVPTTLERLLAIFNAVLRAELSGSEEDVRAAIAVLDESEASRLRNAMYNISELAESQRKKLRRVRGLS